MTTARWRVFAHDGKAVLTDLVFPGPGNLATSVYADGGSATILSLSVAAVR
ncbi:GH32 C-terminal domain-containing protein [Pseudarthrobacter sp. O4]|uniref:GH32 C-terminal domain-containing protein n=1 Tax=Pseudarthrobacter sp. O4 TaxID=3418417 RepID=UPI003CF7D585